MNICKGDDITTIELEPSDFRPESLVSRVILNTDNTVISYVPNETAITMRDRLNELFPPEPDEPESGLPEEPEGTRLLHHPAEPASNHGLRNGLAYDHPILEVEGRQYVHE